MQARTSKSHQKIMEITGDYIEFKTRTRQPTGFSVPAVVWRYYGLNPLDPSTPITLYAERKGREYKGPAYMSSGAEVFAQDPKPSRDPRQARPQDHRPPLSSAPNGSKGGLTM
jgi:hypothetical protein